VGYYHRWEEFPLKEVSYLKGRPEASKLLIRIVSGEKLMATQINAKKGAFVPMHHHEAEQMMFITQGKARGIIRPPRGPDVAQEIGPGDIWIVPSNTPHSIEYVEDCDGIEVVTPLRLDNFIGYTISHTFFDERE
jgi:quercetin dioxygenase-like cupin family protein